MTPGPRPPPPAGPGRGPAPSGPRPGPAPGSARCPAPGHPAHEQREAPRPGRRCRPSARTPDPPARPTEAWPSTPASRSARSSRPKGSRSSRTARGPRCTSASHARNPASSGSSVRTVPTNATGVFTQVAGQELEQAQAGRIGPVQIVDDNEQPSRRRGALQRVQHLLEQAELGRRPQRIEPRRPTRRCHLRRGGQQAGQPRCPANP